MKGCNTLKGLLLKYTYIKFNIITISIIRMIKVGTT